MLPYFIQDERSRFKKSGCSAPDRKNVSNRIFAAIVLCRNVFTTSQSKCYAAKCVRYSEGHVFSLAEA